MADASLAALKADLQKYMKTWASTVAHVASEGLVEETKNALEEFYGSYDPVQYLRTNNILNNSYAPYLKNNGKTYYGGVELSGSRMFEYPAPHQWSNERIFNAVMFSGLHGVHFASNPPYNRIVNFRDMGFFQSYCVEAGDAAAQSQSYQVLQF